MTYPAFLFLGCFLIEGFKSRHTFLGPTTMDNDLTLAYCQRYGFVEVNFVNLISKLTPKSNSNLTRKDTVDKLRQQHIES